MRSASKYVFGLTRDVENDENFGYFEGVIVTFTVYPRFGEFHNFDIQGTR